MNTVRNRNGENGQAVIEMTMSLVAIMAVFLGIIFAYAIGKNNVENIIECRGIADDFAGNGVSVGSYGDTILTWDAGKDERMFTNDDVPVTGAIDDSALFMDELNNGSIDLTSNFNAAYIHHNFAADIPSEYSLFLSMANMTSATIVTDPYENDSLEDLHGAFNSIIYDSDISIENSVFMPIFRFDDE